MVVTEIVLIIIGILALVVSFFVTERLSQKDLDQITLMSEADLKTVAEKQVKEVKRQVETSLEEIIDDSLAVTKRGLERETNNKIMAVSEYSDTVMDAMNKTHNEIIFLYSMLNDKQAETAEMVGDLQKIVKLLRDMDMEKVIAKVETATAAGNRATTYIEKSVEVDPEVETEMASDDEMVDTLEDNKETIFNNNEQILQLYKEGKDEVEIAKTLNCGLGVVRLVLGLYHEA